VGKKSKKTKRDKTKPASTETIKEQEADKFDFGGLPKIDLKKNLGCG